MIKKYLQKFFAQLFYPTNSGDWYKSKGYVGRDEQEQFAQFLFTQTQESARFYDEFKHLKLKRQFIECGDAKLDSVLLTPSDSISADKAGNGLCFVFFQGRGEFYESRFRDMAIQANQTGALILGFNPKGFQSSTGKTETIFDIVDDGIAVIEYLLSELNLLPKQVVLQGNSLGAAVQEMVTEHFRKLYGFRFRQINSNSFKTLAAVLAYHYKVLLLEEIIGIVLRYAEWEIIPSKDFYKTGPYRCHLRRLNDRTIAVGAEYNIKVDIESDCAEAPEGYKKTNRWLYEHCQLIYNGEESSETDPHFLSLHHFNVQDEEGNNHSVYSLINRYLEESEKYIAD